MQATLPIVATEPITTIAAFKRAMQPGSKWMFCANWHPELIERTCTVSQSNSFALTSIKHPGESSWCDWPKASQVTFIVDSVYPEKSGVRIDHDGGWLIYKPVPVFVEGGAA